MLLFIKGLLKTLRQRQIKLNKAKMYHEQIFYFCFFIIVCITSCQHNANAAHLFDWHNFICAASVKTCDENKRRHLLLSLFHQSHHSRTTENSCHCRARSRYHLSSRHIKLHVQLLLARSLHFLLTVGHIWCFLQKNTELSPVHDFYMSWNGMADEFIKRVPTPDAPADIHELAG